MELVDFRFSDDLIGVESQEQYCDLHNDYMFRSHERSGEELWLNWGRLEEHWVSSASPKTVALHISGVSFFEVRGEISEDLDEIGFFDNETFGNVDYNGLSAPRPGFEVLVFRFVGGGELAVRGATASVNLGLK